MRNIPIWDEFDTVLDFLVALDSGLNARGLVERLLAMNNEHRMVVSRLLFASSYWLFGGINFAAIAVIGDLLLVATVGLLVWRAEGAMARLRLGALLGALVFQLQHHENLFWGGSSIDHFLVVLAAVGSLAALSRPGRWSLVVAGGCALAATFTLAHGLLVWPVGLAVLGLQRRWRDAGVWIGVAAAALAAYFSGFAFNPGHHHPGWADMARVGRYWLTLIGCSPALGNADLAPWLGGLFLVGAVAATRQGWRQTERLPAAVIGWCLAAMAMIAWGRTLLSDPWAPLTSRYVILSSLSWALLGWILLERALVRWGRPSLWLAPIVAGLAVFNVVANEANATAGRVFALRSERALHTYYRDGTFERTETPLYPDPAKADALVRTAVERGLYRLPPRESLYLGAPQPVKLTEAEEIGDAAYFIEEASAESPEVRVRGWAFRPGRTLRPGEISIVFRTANDELLAVEPTPLLRPDVAATFARSDANYAGFEVRLPTERLPAGTLQIGICFDGGGEPEYMLTSSRLVVARR